MACFEQLELTGCVLETEDGRRAFNLGYPDHGDVFTLTMANHEESLPSEVTAVRLPIRPPALPSAVIFRITVSVSVSSVSPVS